LHPRSTAVPLPVPGRIVALPFLVHLRDIRGMIGRHLRITGHVQGVGYRYWFIGRAEARGLTGWVRNRADGSVEAVVQGSEDEVARIVAEAGSGPPAARVDRVEAIDQPIDPAFNQLEQRPTC
ncbi:acylphosphatase, partial [Sphingomonas sp. 2378]|uniref:acylphosphatase n=1 Tax=Sphingomonas sp. 2378 TaxID=1219748 RepID=UPI00311AD19C